MDFNQTLIKLNEIFAAMFASQAASKSKNSYTSSKSDGDKRREKEKYAHMTKKEAEEYENKHGKLPPGWVRNIHKELVRPQF